MALVEVKCRDLGGTGSGEVCNRMQTYRVQTLSQANTLIVWHLTVTIPRKWLKWHTASS